MIKSSFSVCMMVLIFCDEFVMCLNVGDGLYLSLKLHLKSRFIRRIRHLEFFVIEDV